MAPIDNPNGSSYAIEGISSLEGRVLGTSARWGHTERRGTNVAKKIPGEKFQQLFGSGVGYSQG